MPLGGASPKRKVGGSNPFWDAKSGNYIFIVAAFFMVTMH
jgi:hypothetical protein